MYSTYYQALCVDEDCTKYYITNEPILCLFDEQTNNIECQVDFMIHFIKFLMMLSIEVFIFNLFYTFINNIYRHSYLKEKNENLTMRLNELEQIIIKKEMLNKRLIEVITNR